LKTLDSALDQSKIRPSNLHDWGSESAIDPINPLVYIQASNLEFESSVFSFDTTHTLMPQGDT
jgi:hypothetical protein